MLDAKKRLLAHATQEPRNQYFVLLSRRLVVFISSNLNLSHAFLYYFIQIAGACDFIYLIIYIDISWTLLIMASDTCL